jgi:hypothetical protein
VRGEDFTSSDVAYSVTETPPRACKRHYFEMQYALLLQCQIGFSVLISAPPMLALIVTINC